ncbi:hypothetical protein JX265_000059 [Neoarthrinium moseri]|uniref:NADH:flavin oxidoreductase/NADH oxidase N-terminal domain-containing protein n=1 Tax=Neoarthrinium moseri TaxID=1658444 RepID=A0A9Q0ARW9_9PEZI|nr:hypothetical protein JX266_008127 [Neoarthrinium moseri]KAI1881233.1 hypothetical protein JX265_000059 [Neoarthrinium moseri]
MPQEVPQADQAPIPGDICAVEDSLVNHGAQGISYFTPVQDPAAGTAWDKQPEGSLFSPLKINGLTLHNRIILSPMCQYSSQDGYMSMWHHVHLGGFATRGIALVMTEVQAVSPEGRISPQDLGLWDDGHVESLEKIVEFAHSQGVKFGVQIGHAGRKASTVAPWVNRKASAGNHSGGWPDNVIAASAEPFSSATITPREATKADIEKCKKDFVAAVKRALKAGVDAIEIHAAHGYLLHSFYSPASNHRADNYGGSFENRTRLTLEIVDLVKAELPKGFPLMVRISATDYLEWDPSLPQFNVDEAVELSKVLADHGVDFIDVSGGGLDARQKIQTSPGYQVPYAVAIKKALGNSKCLVGTVGEVISGKQAQEILDAGSADAVLVGRALLKDPFLVSTWADELKIDVHAPSQCEFPSSSPSSSSRE